jgi:hypothetical protein
MTPYSQFPKNNPEEFMRTVGLSKEDFQHFNDKTELLLLKYKKH